MKLLFIALLMFSCVTVRETPKKDWNDIARKAAKETLKDIRMKNITQ